MPSDYIKVLIADDHEVIREALTLCLEREHDMRVVGEAGDGREALRMTLDTSPDVLLLDLRLPGLDGLQVLAALTSASSRPAVLLMTAHPNDQYLYDALMLGAAGFLTKDIGLRMVPDVVRTALSGKTVIVSPTFPESLGRLAAHESDRTRHLTSDVDLSELQLGILPLLAEGFSNNEIGEKLSINNRAVRAHLTAIYEQIGVRHRTEAVIWAEEQGLIPEG